MARRGGFTLVELLVAITLAGIAVSMAVGVFSTTTDAVHHVGRDARAWDREMNRRAWLAQAFAGAGISAAGAFHGAAERASFRTWLWTAQGWLEPAAIEVGLSADVLVASTPEGEVLLADSVASLAFDYLPRLGADAAFQASWVSDVGLPLAVRMRLQRRIHGVLTTDTALFWIGERG